MGMTGEQAYVLAKKLIEESGGGGGTVDAYTKAQTDNLLIQKVDKETLSSVISDEWNDKTTYEVGQYCIYANKLWKCLVQHSGQTPTEGTYWTQTSIDDEITELNNTLVSKIGFIDTSNVIVQTTTVTSKTEYTATQDCYIIVIASQKTDRNDWAGVKLTINNHMIWEILTKTAKDGCAYNFPLKKGQTIKIDQDGSAMIDSVVYKVLGMI